MLKSGGKNFAFAEGLNPMRFKPVTLIVLLVIGAGLFLLNLHVPESISKTYLIDRPPEGIDPVTSFMFFRGWPLHPCDYCVGSIARWDPDWRVEAVAVLDLVVFLATLAAMAGIGEAIAGLRSRGQFAMTTDKAFVAKR